MLLMMLCGAVATADPVWIDVRSPAEYASGHLPEAHNLPLHEVAVRIRELTADPEADVRVYCGIGVRAQIAKLQLESIGYRNVTNEGGYADILARRQADAARTLECRHHDSTSNETEGPC